MGKGLPQKGATLGLVLAGLALGACDTNQEDVAALETQVTQLKNEKRQVFARLDRAESERNAAESQLSLAQDNVRNLRSEVFALRESVDYLTSQLETIANQTPDTLYLPPPEEDWCQDFYDVGVDCPLEGLVP
ncbi:MAG: hypothetical protein ACKOB2_03010 [Solirubrobacterales bacterium]